MSVEEKAAVLLEEVVSEDKKELAEQSIDKDCRPKIISNELLHLGVSVTSDKLDELTSLEREIAEMHVEPTSVTAHDGTSGIVGGSESTSEIDALQMELQKSDLSRNTTPISAETTNRTGSATSQICETSGGKGNIEPDEVSCTALEHEDLIAVLKGIDHNSENDVINDNGNNIKQIPSLRPPSTTDSELGEGVTIEGEGQFQIMEVVDDESEDLENLKESESTPTVSNAPAKTVGQNSAIPKLTNDEIRAMAMEQIAGLNARSADRMRRRKQDIKPLQVEEPTDLVSSLGAEWSDDDIGVETEGTNVASGTGKKSTAELKSNKSTEIPGNLSESSIPPKVVHITGDVNDSNASGDVASNKDNGKTNEKQEESVDQPQVGFKRTRIIKRKIIWDPDAPETQVSYAQLIRNSAKSNTENKINRTQANTTSNIKRSAAQTVSTPMDTIVVSKKDPIVKKGRPDTPKSQVSLLKDKKTLTHQIQPILTGEKKSTGRATTPKTIIGKVGNTTITTTNPNMQSTKLVAGDDNLIAVKTQMPVKRRSQTPIANGAGNKKKKSSEIDRLVSDEGAANMLHSLENERNKYSAELDDDKPHKPLMRSRASTISERIATSAKSPATVTINTSAKSKRSTKQKPSSTWDYVYKQQASEDAMIIRRRSNSSYSSNASLRRLSLDTPVLNKSVTGTKTAAQNTTQATNATSTKSVSKTERNTQSGGSSSGGNIKQNLSGKGPFEFAKPESKSNQKGNRRAKGTVVQAANPLTSDMKKSPQVLINRRISRSPATVGEKDDEQSIGSGKSSGSKEIIEEPKASSNISDVVVKKAAKVTQILFNTHKAKLNYTFTAHMMNKLVEILDKLSNDDECNVVVIITNSPHFCHGVDFTDLTTGSADKRKHSAVQLATAVKNYLKTLATFPKPLIAGINGSNMGLGVTQLPLFDIVIASDKGTYETPYAKIGQVPEGYCIWNGLTKIRDNYKTKLFWLGEKLHSTESALSGLVNKLTAPSKVNEDALLTAKKIAAMSSESYRFMKKSIIHNHLEAIITALDEEFDTIIEQWTSNECYENFRKYLEVGHF